MIAAVSAISMAALIIGYTTPSETMIAVGRACYFPWVIWFVMIGSRFLKAGRPA